MLFVKVDSTAVDPNSTRGINFPRHDSSVLLLYAAERGCSHLLPKSVPKSVHTQGSPLMYLTVSPRMHMSPNGAPPRAVQSLHSAHPTFRGQSPVCVRGGRWKTAEIMPPTTVQAPVLPMHSFSGSKIKG